MDMLEWGADWLKDMAGQHASQPVRVVQDGVSVTTTASLVDEAGRIIPSTVALKSEHTKFMFETTDVTSLGIIFRRNTIIIWNGHTFEVVQENSKFWTYNDTYRRHIVVPAKHVSD